jgi:polyphosphate kinase
MSVPYAKIKERKRVTPMTKLLRSKDRKVANVVTPNGKQASMANTFGLPAGKAYSCPGATSVCESVCYAGKLEKVFPSVKKNLLHNWALLKDADLDTMQTLISEMIEEFKTECVKRNAPKLFRIHWDGDFFNDTYTQAWKNVILNNTDIQFWVYTRVNSAAVLLKDIANLSLYYSTDSENKPIGLTLKKDHGVKLAYLAKNFAIGQADMKEMIGRPGAKCPENKKAIPLISQQGSACVSCSLCVYSKSDIVFSATKK